MLYHREYRSDDAEGRRVGKSRPAAVQRGAGNLYPTITLIITAKTSRTQKFDIRCIELSWAWHEIRNPAKGNLH